jgi:site-specific DNA-methyltransferase (adenine-specific)
MPSEFDNKIISGDALLVLKTIKDEAVDIIYLDPPFFTQKVHSLTSKSEAEYQFSDKWNSLKEYLQFIGDILTESKRVLKGTGSIFLHCDKTASHYLRVKLDEVFGAQNFRNEIIWTYKRWSNSKKGLLNSHQNIFFYSKTDGFKFNVLYTEYSPTTNLDQILQERERGINGKSKYKVDANGSVVIGKEKKGVPLSDVWEIPFLNPKAKERSGYPTQKPVLLLNQILNIASVEGDTVLDPFCGSGTTCVSAKLLNRKYIGIDISKEATTLTRRRLKEMIVTDSALLRNGKDAYVEKDELVLNFLNHIGAFPVQRNSGIDGYLKRNYNGKPVPVKIQGKDESISDAIMKLEKASVGHGCELKIVVQTCISSDCKRVTGHSDIVVIKSNQLVISELLEAKEPIANKSSAGKATDKLKSSRLPYRAA